MEKSEVSGTDTPTIRQTIQLSLSPVPCFPPLEKRDRERERVPKRKYRSIHSSKGVGNRGTIGVRRESFIGSADFRGPSPLIFA